MISFIHSMISFIHSMISFIHSMISFIHSIHSFIHSFIGETFVHVSKDRFYPTGIAMAIAKDRPYFNDFDKLWDYFLADMFIAELNDCTKFDFRMRQILYFGLSKKWQEDDFAYMKSFYTYRESTAKNTEVWITKYLMNPILAFLEWQVMVSIHGPPNMRKNWRTILFHMFGNTVYAYHGLPPETLHIHYLPHNGLYSLVILLSFFREFES